MNAPCRRFAVMALLLVTHLVAFRLARGPLSTLQPESSGAAIQEEMTALPAKSPGRVDRGESHGRLWQKLLEMHLSRGDFERARDALLGDWAKRDLGAVLDLVYGPETSNRFGGKPLPGVLDDEIARQPEEVLEWLRAGRFGSKRGDLYHRWLQALADRGQYELLLETLPEGSAAEQKDAFEVLANTGKGFLLDAIRKRLSSVPADQEFRNELVGDYAMARVSSATADMASLFAGEDDPAVRNALGTAWLLRKGQGVPTAETFACLGELPQDIRLLVGKGMLQRVCDFGEDEMLMPALVEMGRLELWSGMTGKDLQMKMSEVAGDRDTQSDPLLDGLLSLKDASVRQTLLKAAGEGLASRYDAESGSALIFEKLPPGPERDAGLEGMAHGFMGGWDREGGRTRARQILPMIQDPVRRAAAEDWLRSTKD